jgi:predicted ATPase
MAHYIGYLVGFDLPHSPHLAGAVDDARQTHRQAQNHLMQLFVHALRRYPVIIELQDIQWADESSLDTINRLVTQNTDLRLLVICLARPELYERRPTWGSGQPFHTRLDLRPLSNRESRRLVEEVLQKADTVPDSLRELIVDQAEGNPFYIEELIKVLIEDHVIVKEEPAWRIEMGRLSGVRIPSTLTSLIQARLDNLFPAERIVLQRAAVIGRIFWDSAVHALSVADTLVIDVDATLNTLAERELVHIREESAFAGTREFIISSGVLRDVVYEGILGRQRRTYHALVAKWLIECSGDRTDEFAGLISSHLEQASELEQAVIFLRRAGEQAAAQYASAEAISYLNHALDLKAEGAPSDCYALLMALYRVYEMTGNYPAASVAAQGAMSMAQACRDIISEAAGLLSWGEVLWHQGAYAQAQHRLEQALDLVRAVQSDPSSEHLPAEPLYSALARDFHGFFVPFRWRLGPAALSRALEADSLRTLGIIANARGEYTRAGEYHRQALQIFRQLGDHRGQARVLHNLGNVHRNQGDYTGARAHFSQALQIYHEVIGDVGGECLALACLGLIDHNEGHDQRAREKCRQALQTTQDTGDRHVQGYALTFLGHALVGLAQQSNDGEAALAWAKEAYEQAIILREELAQRHMAMECRAGLARVLLAQGSPEQARRHVDEILHYLETGTLDGTVEPLQVYLTCYHVLRAEGAARADEILTDAYDLLQERAWQIVDEALRRSYLEDVSAHREIVKDFARLDT